MDPREESDDAHSDYSDDDHEGLAGTRSTVTFFPKEPSPETVESSLEHAIDAAPEIEVRALLKDLVRAQAAAKTVVTKRLLVSIAGSESRKRKAIEFCGRCRKDYRVTDNIEGCCSFHPGEKELDDTDVWGDEFDPIPGPDDPGSNDWYNWSCCGAEGDETGCAIGSHVPILSAAKRVRA